MNRYWPVSAPVPAPAGEASSPAKGWEWLLSLTFLMMLVANNVFRKPTLVILLLLHAPFLFGHLRAVFALALRSTSMVMLWGLVIASVWWSVVPGISAGLVWVQAAFILLAAVLACRHRSQGFYGALRTAALVYLALEIGRAHV